MLGEGLSIQLTVKIAACALIAGVLTTKSPAQTTQPAPDSSAQQTTQPQEAAKTPEQAAQPASQQPPSDKTPSQGPASAGKVAGTSNDRLFYALPNFLTVDQTAKLPPLSTKDKFKVVALGTFDPVQYPWWAAIAAISQASNGERAYGQGWLGYAKRYGSTAADSSIENFMVGAVFPSLLHQDPRFYYSSTGGAGRRTFYAVSRLFVTRTDSGKPQFNFSEIFGAATAATISTNLYHPKGTYISTPRNPHLYISSERTLGNTAETYVTQLGLDAMTIVIKEFWPDIHRKMGHKKRATAPAPGE